MLISTAALGNGEYLRILWEDGPSARIVWHLALCMDDVLDDEEPPEDLFE